MSKLCRLMNTRTHVYIGDPDKSGEIRFVYQGKVKTLAKIETSFMRAQIMHEDRAWPMMARNRELAMIRIED